MRYLPLMLLLLTACEAGPEPLESTPPDAAGWSMLTVEDVRIERQADQHVLTVDTRTRSAGWEVDLLPYTYNRAPRITTLRLVGRAPQNVAAQVITDAVAVKTLKLSFETKFVEVEGVNGSYKVSVPWSPGGN